MSFQDQRCYRTGQPLRVSFQKGEHLFAEMDRAQIDPGGDTQVEGHAPTVVTRIRNGVTSRLTLPAAAQNLTVQSLRRCRCAAN